MAPFSKPSSHQGVGVDVKESTKSGNDKVNEGVKI